MNYNIIMCEEPRDALILGLVGQKRVGKDTFADYLVNNYGFVKLAFAEPIKHIASIVFNLDYDKLDDMDKEAIMPDYGISLRQFYQKFGTELMRNDLYNHLPELESKVPKHYIWIHNLLQRIQKYRAQGQHRFVISDVRFTDEATSIFEIGGKLVRINREGFGGTDGHSSETTINEIPASMIKCEVKNEGDVEYYHATIKHIMKKHFPGVLPTTNPNPIHKPSYPIRDDDYVNYKVKLTPKRPYLKPLHHDDRLIPAAPKQKSATNEFLPDMHDDELTPCSHTTHLKKTEHDSTLNPFSLSPNMR